MGRVLACQSLYGWSGPAPVWPSVQNACKWSGELTLYQQKAADKIAETMNKGDAELLTWAVCGAGKTEMLFYGIGQSLEAGKRVCLATPRADVVRELLPRFRAAFPEIAINGLYGGSEDKAGDGQLILATTHQLLRFGRAFDVVIIDEIDAFPFHIDASLPFAADRAAKEDAARIYLTATPRKNHRRLVDAGKLPHVFVPVRFHGHPLPVPKLHMCFSLKKSLQQNQPPKAFFDWLEKRENPDRQLLIFTSTIELAAKMEKTLSAYFGEITAVHAADPDRADKVQSFRDKKLSVLITTTILERGVTFPSVDVVIFDAGHPVFDEAALVQIAGRAGRSPDDPTGEVIFYHDGKTAAMIGSVQSIKKMNKRAGV
nr:helicase-related protein [Sediminibacillus massiliensis]